MRTIIAGSRNIQDISLIMDAVRDSGFQIDEVVSGGARGVDSLGEEWAKRNGVPVTVFPAEWNAHGKAAGPIRNTAMANYADALIAVWDGTSRGTNHMIRTAKSKGLKVFVHKV